MFPVTIFKQIKGRRVRGDAYSCFWGRREFEAADIYPDYNKNSGSS